MPNIWNDVSEEMRKHILRLMDETRMKVVSGKLAGLIIIPIPVDRTEYTEALTVGSVEEMTYAMRKMELNLIQLESHLVQQQAQPNIKINSIAPEKREA